MATYRLVSDGESWTLGAGENVIGRYSHCQVALDAEDVAGEHARVDVFERSVNGRHAGERLALADLGTPVGTFLDDVRVAPEQEGGAVRLRAGQEIRVGSVTLRVEMHVRRARWLSSIASPRLVRTAAKVAAGLFAALGLLVVVSRLVYNSDRLRRDIVKAFESGLGRDTEIASIDYPFFGGRTELRGLVVRNLPEFGGEPLLQVAGVVVRFRSGGFYSLLGGRLRVDITLHQPVLFIQRDERGRWNVGDLVRAFGRFVWAEGEGLRERLPFSVLELHLGVRDATVRIRDDRPYPGETGGRGEEITGITFDCDLPGLGEPVTYRLDMALPAAARPGRVSAEGEFRLFAGRDIHAETVHGEMLRLAVEGLDLGAWGGLHEPARRFLAASCGGRRGPDGGAPHGSALDLKCTLTVAGLRSVKLEAKGRLSSGALRHTQDAAGHVTFEAELSGDLLGATLDAGTISVRGADWEFTSQGRVVPAEEGAEILDVDTTLRAPLAAVLRLCGAPGDGTLSGNVELRLSTTGSTKDLGVRADVSVSGLYSPATYAPPEDVRASFSGAVGFVRRSQGSGITIDSVRVKSFSAEASFLDAALAPGRIEGLAARASARLGPFEFDLDLEELARRYGPAIPRRLLRLARAGSAFDLPGVRLHGWASAQGKEGRIEVRHAVEVYGGEMGRREVRARRMPGSRMRGGPRLEGVATFELGAAGLESIELDEKLLPARLPTDMAGGAGGGDIAATLRGVVRLVALEGGPKGPEPEPGPHLELALTSSGELSRVLELVRPYLGQVGSVWARGRFNLADARFEGTPRRFATRGRIELLGPELWGGSPMTLPFSEPRIDAIWNVECDLTKEAVRVKVNVLKASSSTLQFKLEGEADDLGRLLGHCDLRAFADFDRIGTVLKKLDLLPSAADLRGTMNIDLGADTRRGRLELRSFSIDTPFLEARGGGQVRHVPVAVLGRLFGGGAPASVSLERAAEEMEGSIKIGATFDVEGVEALLGALAAHRRDLQVLPGIAAEDARTGERARGGFHPVRRGQVKVDLQAEGSGGELLVKGELDFDRFAGRLGRYLLKSPDELASVRFSASIGAGKPDLFTLSGVLTLGGRDAPARLELGGRLASGLDRFEVTVKSERFPVGPLAALVPELGPRAEGAAALDLRVRGKLREGRFVPGSIELDGRADLHGVELAWRKIEGLRGRFDGSVRFSGPGIRADGLKLLVRTSARGVGGAGPAGLRIEDTRFEDAGLIEFEDLSFARAVRPGMPSGTFRARAKAFDLGSVLRTISARPTAADEARRETTRSDVMKTVMSLLGLRFDGSLAAERMKLWAGGPEVTRLEASASVGWGGVEVRGFECGLWGGRAKGSLTFGCSEGRAGSTGELSAEGMDLERIAVSAGVPGALSGKARATVRWTGEGFTREDLARSWEIELDGETGEFSIDPDLWPVAGEVRDAVDLLLGTGTSPSARETAGVRAQPVSVRARMRRGRISMEATELELDTGLRLGVSGRAELDGRIAGWVAVDALPRDLGGLRSRQEGHATLAALQGLMERGLLRFGVTGTRAAPVADVRGLLWMLLESEQNPFEERLEEELLGEPLEGDAGGEIEEVPAGRGPEPDDGTPASPPH